MQAFLAELPRGARALLVEGEAGIGKTAVWRAALEEAAVRGCRVLGCAGEQAEARLSFVGLGDLVGGVMDEVLGALPGPQREALEFALVRRRGSEGGVDAKAVTVGLRSLLVELALQGPVVVAVDDVQWLDGATARALAFVVRRLEGHPVGVLAAVRTPPAAPDPLGLERAFGPDRFGRVRLGRLSVGALRAVLERGLGFQYPRPVLLRIEQVTGGNPLFALELARVLGPEPAFVAGVPLPVPESLRELVAGLVANLGAEGRWALLAAAALSHPSKELVEQVSSPEGLTAVEEEGLLRVEAGRIVFAHPLYASAVYAAAASGRRQAVHGRLAGLVADPEEQARHLALAASPPDDAVAAALDTAAAHARAGCLGRRRTPARGGVRVHAARPAGGGTRALPCRRRAPRPLRRPATRARPARAPARGGHPRPAPQRRATPARRNPLQRGQLRHSARTPRGSARTGGRPGAHRTARAHARVRVLPKPLRFCCLRPARSAGLGPCPPARR